MEQNFENGTTDELQACVLEVEESSRQLREALMRRDNDAIWDAVARQEEASNKFLKMRETPGIFESLTPETSQLIRDTVNRTRGIQKVNRALTRVFMKIIDSTLNAISRPDNAEPLTYSPAGYATHSPGPMFVQQMG